MQENISPEEKLLNLIKKGKEDTQEKSDNQSKSQEPVQKPAKKVKRIIHGKARVKKGRYINSLNRFLIIVILTAIAYMVISYLYIYKSKIKIPESGEIRVGQETPEAIPKSPPPLSHYTDVLGRRQMFRLYEVPTPKPTGPPKPKVTLQQLIGGYTFVGIIFGDVPQAIVEEKRTGQSFYLTAGQSLGEVKIEKIERGKITVSYEDERMDISI